MIVLAITASQWLLFVAVTVVPLLALLTAAVASLVIISRLGEKWLLLLIVVMAMMSQHQILEGIEFVRSGGTSLAPVQETFETAANLILAGSAYYVLSFARDERRLAEELQQSKERYTQLVENAPSPILVAREGRIRYANPMAGRFLEVDASEDLQGSDLLSFVHPDDRQRMQAELERAAERAQPTTLAERRFTVDGVTKRATSVVAPVVYDAERAAQLVLEDVTERREYERQLAETFRNTNDGVFIIDPEADEILEVNRRACEIVGYDREELLDLPASAVHPDEMEQLRQFTEAVSADGGVRTEALSCRRSDGRTIPAEISGSLIEFEGRDCLLATVRDISERKRRERRLRVLDRILRHNLRNDMNVVMGRAETLESEVSEPRLADVAGTIRETAADLLAMSDDLHRVQSTIDRDGDLAPATVDAAPLLAELLGECRERYPDAEITADLPDELAVRGTAALEMAVGEVVENAVVHNDEPVPAVDLAVEEESIGEGWVDIRITDNGPGIPEHERAVFEGDAEITPLQHGSGIGLWTAIWIVEAFDGEVTIADDTDGTTVVVRLERAGRVEG